MQNFINKKVLVTTQGWFYGKDGRSYRAVHGTLKLKTGFVALNKFPIVTVNPNQK